MDRLRKKNPSSGVNLTYDITKLLIVCSTSEPGGNAND